MRRTSTWRIYQVGATPSVGDALSELTHLDERIGQYHKHLALIAKEDERSRHPRELGAAEVEQFLTMLTTQRNVAVSTHNQALSALLFLLPRGSGGEVAVD